MSEDALERAELAREAVAGLEYEARWDEDRYDRDDREESEEDEEDE